MTVWREKSSGDNILTLFARSPHAAALHSASQPHLTTACVWNAPVDIALTLGYQAFVSTALSLQFAGLGDAVGATSHSFAEYPDASNAMLSGFVRYSWLPSSLSCATCHFSAERPYTSFTNLSRDICSLGSPVSLQVLCHSAIVVFLSIKQA